MAGTQIFVRNREGKVFGPIEPSTVELLIESGVLQGLLQVSTDGEHYALPFRFPELRDVFPRHLWGDDSRKDVQLDAEAPAAPVPGAGGPSAALFGASPGSEPRSTPPPGPASAVPPPTLSASEALPVLDPDEAAEPVAADGGDLGAGELAPDEPFVPQAPAGPAPPVLTAAPTESLAPPPPRPPLGVAPPVLTPPETRSTRSASPLQPEDAWAEAVPFELAPPGASKPPARAPAPVTSTFSLLRADLAETNALKIYVQAARAGATGLFFFDLEDRTATLYMRRGNPESAESTHESDAIGPFLLAQRLATSEQVARAEKEEV
ncbi:MAG TPA: hypothetical protein VFN91_12145 [Myxococcaceae bacterium]|nr:hypothetical protein [Myxococcaceae bacterium]